MWASTGFSPGLPCQRRIIDIELRLSNLQWQGQWALAAHAHGLHMRCPRPLAPARAALPRACINQESGRPHQRGSRAGASPPAQGPGPGPGPVQNRGQAVKAAGERKSAGAPGRPGSTQGAAALVSAPCIGHGCLPGWAEAPQRHPRLACCEAGRCAGGQLSELPGRRSGSAAPARPAAPPHLPMNMYKELEAAPAMTFSWGCQARCSSLLWKSAFWASMPASCWGARLARLLLACREMPNRCVGCERASACQPADGQGTCLPTPGSVQACLQAQACCAPACWQAPSTTS